MEPPDDPLHRALTSLPAPRAPRSLLPRVMAAVDIAEAERRRREAASWRGWSLEWKLASAVAFVAFALAVVVIEPGARWYVEASPVFRLGSIVWETYVQHVIGYVVAWIVLMSAACAAFGAALGRVALGGASQ